MDESESSGPSEPQRQAIDVLDDDGAVTVFRGDWIEAPPLRGTGCMLSAAIAAGLAHGMSLNAAVTAAKEFVCEALRGNTSQPEEKLARSAERSTKPHEAH